MPKRIRKAMMTSAAFLLTTGVASAENFIDDDPFAGETALSAAELSEARGGFSAGGFKFNFGVTFSPIFGDGGVFGDKGSPIPDDGLFGNDGLFGEDGVFGEGGVFGDTGTPGNSSSSTSTTLTDVTMTTTTTTTETTSGSQSATGAASGGASSAPPASSGSTPPGGGATTPSSPGASAASAPPQNVNTPDAVPAPQSAGATTDLPLPAKPGSTTGELAQSEAGAAFAEAQSDGKALGDTAPTGTQLVLETSSSPNAAALQQQYSGMDVSEVIKHQLTFVYNNSKDGAKLQQDIDFNIGISNYDQNIALMGIASSVARTIPDRSIFNSLF